MTIKNGDNIPEIKFCLREGDVRPESGTCPIGGRFVEKTTHDLFGGKRVIVFLFLGLLHQHAQHINYQALKITMKHLKN